MIIRDNFCYICMKIYIVTPHLNASNEGSQYMVSVRNKKTYLSIIPQLSSNAPSYLEL